MPWAVFWALAGQGILSITRFFSKMVVGGRFGSGEAGYGSEAELGYYDAAFGILMLLMGLHEALITTPLTYFNHREKETGEQRFAGKMLLLSAIFAFVALAVTVVMVGYQYVAAGTSSAFLWTLIALMLMVPFQTLKEFMRRWLLANLEVRQSAILELGFALCFIVLIGTLIVTAQINAATVLCLTGVANLLCVIVCWKVYSKSFSLDYKGVRTQGLENIRYGRWIAGENICSVVMIYFSQWFLISQIGEKEAGVYSACLTIVCLANPFLLGVSSVFAPRSAQVFAERGWRGLSAIFLSYSALVTVVMVAFSTTLYFFGGQLTELAFGDHYANYFDANCNGVNSLTFILSLAMPCFGLSFLLTCCILAAGQPIFSFYAALVGMFVSISVNFMFADPTPHTAGISFAFGALATMAFRAVVVLKLYRNFKRSNPA